MYESFRQVCSYILRQRYGVLKQLKFGGPAITSVDAQNVETMVQNPYLCAFCVQLAVEVLGLLRMFESPFSALARCFYQMLFARSPGDSHNL
jgi:hypothetical protein